jgi:DNA topoisomerase-1
LATDPDREGEAISWHLLNSLKLNEAKASRITFNEITKSAVKDSIKQSRQINMMLVNAQQARRALDRIVGYTISPILWKKIKKGLSAGRVQSAALKVICDREEDIKSFIKEEYWNIEAIFSYKNEKFVSNFIIPKDMKLNNEKIVIELLEYLKTQEYIVTKVKEGTKQRKPYAPFTTSTMQQEASRLFNFSTDKTMRIAQQLYEGVEVKSEGFVGLVSYIRTDSVRISDEAYKDCTDFIVANHGNEYKNLSRPIYKIKGRAQDAHEAIRPTSTIRTPQQLVNSLSRDQLRLYRLIWERFVASQMSPALYSTISIDIAAGEHRFKSYASFLIFEGYKAVYKRNEEAEEKSMKIPKLEKGNILKLIDIKPFKSFTKPPARYTESSFVKMMEDCGIGRPSTYSSTIATLLARRYVVKEKKAFYITELGEIINDIMKNNFNNIVDIEFTANMESELDKIEDGELEWKDILRRFYPEFKDKLDIAEQKISNIKIEDEKTEVHCKLCNNFMVVKYGKYGKFLACPGFPDCKYVEAFYEEAGVPCPYCKEQVIIKKSKRGRLFYGCKNSDCEFIAWNKPTQEKCPICDSYLVEKGTKNIKLACSNEECKFHKNKE